MSVVGYFQGQLGTPPGGFPAELREAVLKGLPRVEGRASASLAPFDLAGLQKSLGAKLGRELRRDEAISAALYPRVMDDYFDAQARYEDVSILDTPTYFYGLEVGQEIFVELEPGKTLVVGLSAVGRPDEKGMRTVYFELNGHARQVSVRDRSHAVAVAEARKAERGNPEHVGASMPGTVVAVHTKAGDRVDAGAPLVTLEAMKMETVVRAPRAGAVKELLPALKSQRSSRRSARGRRLTGPVGSRRAFHPAGMRWLSPVHLGSNSSTVSTGASGPDLTDFSCARIRDSCWSSSPRSRGAESSAARSSSTTSRPSSRTLRRSTPARCSRGYRPESARFCASRTSWTISSGGCGPPGSSSPISYFTQPPSSAFMRSRAGWCGTRSPPSSPRQSSLSSLQTPRSSPTSPAAPPDSWPRSSSGPWCAGRTDGARARLLLFAAACLSKEVALVFPAFLAVRELTRSPASGLRWLPAAGALAAVILGVLALSPRYRELLAFSLDLRDPLANLGPALRGAGVMISLWVRPWALAVDHGPPPESLLLTTLVLFAVGAAVAGAIAMRRREPLVTFCVAWPLLALAPTNSLIAKIDLVTEKPLYLAWVGPSILLGVLLARPEPGGRRTRWVAATALLCAWAVFVPVRVRVWSDARLLWSDSVRKAPDRARAWNNLGLALWTEGQDREAARALEESLRLDPGGSAASVPLWLIKRRLDR